MAVMPSIWAHTCYILVKLCTKNVTVTKKSHLEAKGLKFLQLGHFLHYCPFRGGYFCSVDLEMAVYICLRVCLRVFAYGKGEF